MSASDIGDGLLLVFVDHCVFPDLKPAVLVGVIGGSGLYNLSNLTEVYVRQPEYHFLSID
jgi:purine nucleoside phosphorylase